MLSHRLVLILAVAVAANPLRLKTFGTGLSNYPIGDKELEVFSYNVTAECPPLLPPRHFDVMSNNMSNICPCIAVDVMIRLATPPRAQWPPHPPDAAMTHFWTTGSNNVDTMTVRYCTPPSPPPPHVRAAVPPSPLT
jgi:hypothetical protein